MAGGLGTRLRPLTTLVPKPMVPVVNKPILEHTLNLLRKHGVTEIVLLLYYLPNVFENYFGDGSAFGVSIEYVTAGEDYGTSGAVRLAAESVSGEPFLVISGDALTDLNITELIRFHEQKRSLATIALSRVWNPSPFGIAITDEEQRIVKFLEKPSWSQVFSDTVNMGIYVLEPDILREIPEKKESYFAKDIFPSALKHGQALYGFISSCYWRDIGDLKTYQEVHWDVLNKVIDLPLPGSEKENLVHGKGCNIAQNAQFAGKVLLGDDCEIGEGVILQDCVVGHRCRIGAGSRLKQVILWDDVQIGGNCTLKRDVVGSHCSVGDNSTCDEYVFIGNHTMVMQDCRVNANVKIWPEKIVDVGCVVNTNLVWGDRWQRELFTDSRVTGLANYEINPEFAAKLGAAFGTWIGAGSSVLISRDATPASRMIYRALITGLMSAGVNVDSVQVMPIPIVRYTLRSSKERGGVHVRRSPFDRNLIDIMFFDRNGRDFSALTTRALERSFYREDFPRVDIDSVGKIDYPVRITESYVQDFLQKVDVEAIEQAGFKVVIDYSFGAATQVFPSVLGSLDCEVISLDAYLDSGRLVHTQQEFENSLRRLSDIVKSTQADVGFLIDAGAEKIFCVDEKGRVIRSERLAVLVAHQYLNLCKARKIAVPVSCPRQVEEIARGKGVAVLYTAEDGGSIIKATEDPEIDFALGTSGGFIFSDFHFAFDGMFSLAKMLEFLAKSQQSLGELNDSIAERAYLSDSVHCPWEAKGKAMRLMAEHAARLPHLMLDGVKLFHEDAWVLILPDREKAQCRIICESGDSEQARKLLLEYKDRIRKWTKH